MNIHEYQAKALLKSYGAPVSRGVPVMDASEAEAAAKELGGPVWVVKSQIHAGGRGKGKFKEASAGEAGGVRVVKSVEDVKANVAADARRDAGDQADRGGGQAGQPPLRRGRLGDRQGVLPLRAGRPRLPGHVAFVVSTEGGMDIEEVAHSTPEKIVTLTVDPATGVMPHHGRSVAKALQLTGDLAKQARGWSKSSTRPSSAPTWRCWRSTR